MSLFYITYLLQIFNLHSYNRSLVADYSQDWTMEQQDSPSSNIATENQNGLSEFNPFDNVANDNRK